MRIDPELAATVAAVIDEGTLEAAARRLNVSPSAISQRIKSLEQQLGRVLLVRSKPAAATPAGEAVVRLARQVALLDHDTAAALDLGEAGERVVTIPLAVNADSMATWFLAPLARLSRRHPVVFDVHRDDQDFTAALLESGTVMGAVTSQSTPVAGCRVSPLGVLAYEAVATPDYVARWLPEGVDAAALARAPLVDFDRRDGLQTDWLRARGVVADDLTRHYVPASHDFALAVVSGLGWGMLPAVQSADALADGRLVRLGDPVISVALYWQQWNLRSPLLSEIAEEIAAEAARVLA
ncbi:MAG TPA: LysR family transcriptional regulator ArgP [Microbacterium sp.]|uniref:LysR family transcriptional regulator ArgP n=1 Tax=Microbacterium sp. TaxID=51671 RepID=UPI002C79BE2A|nr:LysR family transcriptional regulator ArgP [Microbacterium sp.]HWI31867.1 LysR family transcriptional regulator ArgP [Microbacterium sp.]